MIKNYSSIQVDVLLVMMLFSVVVLFCFREPEDRGSKVLQNTETIPQHYMVSQPKRPQLEPSQPQKPQILYHPIFAYDLYWYEFPKLDTFQTKPRSFNYYQSVNLIICLHVISLAISPYQISYS
jgi:hypothetical protein